MVSEPAFRLYRLDMTSSRSEVVFTGKKRLRGTLMPSEFSKLLTAAPTAVSSWITFKPPSKVCGDKGKRSLAMLSPSFPVYKSHRILFFWLFSCTSKLLTFTLGLTIISISMELASCNRLIAGKEIHKLFVLKILNLDTDLNSSTWGLGTCAISTNRSFPSYWVSVPPWNWARETHYKTIN